MPQVVIIVGSETDMPKIKDSGMMEILDHFDVQYEVSVISAHRHPDELKKYVQSKMLAGTEHSPIFIAAAGMAAALPGAIASHARGCPVIGVALSDGTLFGMDASLSIFRMPKGIPIAFMGIDKPALINAAILACQIIAAQDLLYRGALCRYLCDKVDKPPQIPTITKPEPNPKEVPVG